MIENEFLFLGLLAEGPKHGYEIKRQIEKELVPAIGYSGVTCGRPRFFIRVPCPGCH